MSRGTLTSVASGAGLPASGLIFMGPIPCATESAYLIDRLQRPALRGDEVHEILPRLVEGFDSLALELAGERRGVDTYPREFGESISSASPPSTGNTPFSSP